MRKPEFAFRSFEVRAVEFGTDTGDWENEREFVAPVENDADADAFGVYGRTVEHGEAVWFADFPSRREAEEFKKKLEAAFQEEVEFASY